MTRFALMIAVLAGIAASANAQVVADPPYDAPDAQDAAEYRFVGAMLGFMPPPVGWVCVLVPYRADMPWLQDAACQPDPAVLAEQERQKQEWLDELVRRSERIRSRLGIGRSR